MRKLKIIRPLGSGAVGTVYLASLEGQRGFSHQVAVKVVLNTRSANTEFLARMRDEARLLGLLNDDHMLQVLELVRVEGRDAVVMEYVEGVDLSQLMDRGTQFPARALAELGATVAGTLHRAHEAVHPETGEPLNVIHRDVKPGNVMVTRYGSVKLLDFGVARARFESREAHTGQLVLGTLNYMAPEYVLTGQVTSAADIYGLGVVLWEAASGQKLGHPKIREKSFQARKEEALAQIGESHAILVPILDRLIAWDPESRPTGLEAERELLQAADSVTGSSLRSFTATEVPAVLRAATDQPEDPAGLTGRTFDLSAEGGDTDTSLYRIRDLDEPSRDPSLAAHTIPPPADDPPEEPDPSGPDPSGPDPSGPDPSGPDPSGLNASDAAPEAGDRSPPPPADPAPPPRSEAPGPAPSPPPAPSSPPPGSADPASPSESGGPPAPPVMSSPTVTPDSASSTGSASPSSTPSSPPQTSGSETRAPPAPSGGGDYPLKTMLAGLALGALLGLALLVILALVLFL